MTGAGALIALSGLCIALAGCATHAGGSNAAGPAETQAASSQLTLDSPISEICDDPDARAVLDRNLPDLRKNANYFLFQGFSLRQLASMSGGKITQAKLESVRVGLAATPRGGSAPMAAR